MELVNAVEIVPRDMRNPPNITTGWKPNRLLSTVDKGAEETWMAKLQKLTHKKRVNIQLRGVKQASYFFKQLHLK